jgi:hypothetical protein
VAKRKSTIFKRTTKHRIFHPSGLGRENSECRRNKIRQHLPDSLFKEGHCCEKKLFYFAKSNIKVPLFEEGLGEMFYRSN